MNGNPDIPPATFTETLISLGNMTFPDEAARATLLREYRPWRKVRYIAPDLGLDAAEAWKFVKYTRLPIWKALGLRQSDRRPFGLSIGPHLLEPLHRIDRATGGGGAAGIVSPWGSLNDEEQRRRYRIKTLMDEAAESSLIEGAATTRKDAIELLRSGRAPVQRGERMVANNYAAMQQIKAMTDQPLSTQMLLELQVTLTKGTLDDAGAAGRFRMPDENIRVEDSRDNSVIFVPPAADTLPERVEEICQFANRDHEGPEFLHPIVKASILHFMLGYVHPFVDGNGRTARAVFYWFALRHGYDIFEYLTISEIIRKGYARYPQAYLDTELDEGDLTYFVLYKLDVIEQALDRLAGHLQQEEQRLKQSEQVLKLAKDLNLRQRLLLEHALRRPSTLYTVKSHMNSSGISINTARTDLDDLVRRRLMVTSKRAREVIYHPAPDLRARLTRKSR